jgi:hypothetical protein
MNEHSWHVCARGSSSFLPQPTPDLRLPCLACLTYLRYRHALTQGARSTRAIRIQSINYGLDTFWGHWSQNGQANVEFTQYTIPCSTHHMAMKQTTPK